MRTPKSVMWAYALIILVGVLAALPNLFTQSQLAAMPSWLPKHQITLGLDLQGGSHLVLEINSAALKHDRLQSLLADARTTLRKDGIKAEFGPSRRRCCRRRGHRSGASGQGG